MSNKNSGLNIEFICDKLVESIKSTRSLLDKLIIALLIISLVGYYKESVGLEFLDDSLSFLFQKDNFEIKVAVCLFSIFALIGSLLIDYIDKRKKLDDLWDLHGGAVKEIDGFQELPISSSMYEYVYRLKSSSIKKSINQLWLPAGIILLTFLFISHYIAINLILKAKYLNNYRFLLSGFWILLYFLLYKTFLHSVKKANANLASILKKCILAIFVVFIVIFIVNFKNE